MSGIPNVVASTGVCVPFAVIGPRGTCTAGHTSIQVLGLLTAY